MTFLKSVAALIFAATPALAVETGVVDLRYGSLTGDPGTFSSARLSGETALAFGAWGFQLGATLSHLTDADQNAARILAYRDLGAHLRLGLSTARASFDGAESDAADIAIHALWMAPGARIDASLVLPDHVDTTGAFTYDISGVQSLGRGFAVTTDLYRLSTDLELDDFWSITVGLRYDATDRMTVTAAGIRSTADDYNFDNRMARFGLDWALTDTTVASASLLHLVTADDGNQTGLEVRLARSFGTPADTSRLFDSGPLTDRFAIGAFEP